MNGNGQNVWAWALTTRDVDNTYYVKLAARGQVVTNAHTQGVLAFRLACR